MSSARKKYWRRRSGVAHSKVAAFGCDLRVQSAFEANWFALFLFPLLGASDVAHLDRDCIEVTQKTFGRLLQCTVCIGVPLVVCLGCEEREVYGRGIRRREWI